MEVEQKMDWIVMYKYVMSMTATSATVLPAKTIFLHIRRNDWLSSGTPDSTSEG